MHHGQGWHCVRETYGESAHAGGAQLFLAESPALERHRTRVIEANCGIMTAKPSLAKFFVPCNDQLPRGMERIGIEFADYHFVRFEPDVSAIEGVVRGLRCKKQPHISVQCPRGVARSQSSMGTRHETPLPPGPGPQDGHDRNLFVAHLSANGGQLSSMTSAFVLRCVRRLRFKMLAPPSF